jgi:hypothetical protein
MSVDYVEVNRGETMTAFKHDEIQQMRTMEGWSRDQESDHLRQTRIANFIESLALVAHDLLRTRNAYLLTYGQGNIAKNLSSVGFDHSRHMDQLECEIRQHSIRTFGEDIFMPGDPAKLLASIVPPEIAMRGETNHDKV